jgi:adenylyl-sulfate kinase
MGLAMSAERAFPGRVFFDHIPKTAGQAVSAWLADQLGSGSVSPNLGGNHGDLIRQYGGRYSVIAAHAEFHDKEGLDPRYRYMTILRDPVERVVSWLYYVTNNHTPQQLGALHAWAQRFLDSDGTDLADGLVAHIGNCYVEHFSRIFGSGLASGQDKTASSLRALRQYDVVGLYRNLQRFSEDVGALIGVPAPPGLAHVNPTIGRPPVSKLAGGLRERIAALNQLDIDLYRQVTAAFGDRQARHPVPRAPAVLPIWKKYEAQAGRLVTTPDLAVVAVAAREGGRAACGQTVHIDVDFSLARAVGDLVLGIHVLDGDGRLAFGINSALLGQSYTLGPGCYRATHQLTAALKEGKYTAGVSFLERLDERDLELGWQDVSCEIELHGDAASASVGYAALPARIALQRAAAGSPEPARTAERNVAWHAAAVLRADYEQLNGNGGAIVWCTGLPASGKSTLAHAAAARLHALGIRAYVLDGDNVRHGLCADLGFSAGDRAENIRRVGEVAKMFLDTGMIVLVAFISPSREDRERVRNAVAAGDFLEVYCRCSLEVCEQRDRKGLYRKARAGGVPEFTGISAPYEEPLTPDLVADTGELDLDQCVERLLALLRQRGLLGPRDTR